MSAEESWITAAYDLSIFSERIAFYALDQLRDANGMLAVGRHQDEA